MFSFFKNLINIEELNLNFPFFRKKRLNKTNTNILFIDDEDFPIISNLRRAGWSVECLRDLRNPQDESIVRAHIIFVDFKGVGKYISETDEGIGVIRLIKSTYGRSKRVILYSGYGRFNLGMDMQIADNQMSKNSDTYQFISMIESELKKIK